jgi:acyl dehydratase
MADQPQPQPQTQPPTERPDDVFDVEHIGVWGDTVEFAVTAERIVAYAAATNDDIKPHRAGDFAAPVFAVVPPFDQLAAVTLAAVPPHLMLRIVHGEHDLRQYRPIVPGDQLACRGKVLGIHGKSSGVVVTTLLETRDATGVLVNEQYVAGFFRGGRWPHEAGEPFPPHALDPAAAGSEPAAVGTNHYDDDQTWRYAEASGDPMPIHTDDAFAKQMGFGGIIVHGLCTMAMASQAVITHVCADDPQRLSRLAVRFSAVGRPGQSITTRVWDTGPARVAFDTTNDAGDVLITDGLAEFAS